MANVLKNLEIFFMEQFRRGVQVPSNTLDLRFVHSSKVSGIRYALIKSFLRKWLWRNVFEWGSLWRMVFEVKYGSAWGGWGTKEVMGPGGVSLCIYVIFFF